MTKVNTTIIVLLTTACLFATKMHAVQEQNEEEQGIYKDAVIGSGVDSKTGRVLYTNPAPEKLFVTINDQIIYDAVNSPPWESLSASSMNITSNATQNTLNTSFGTQNALSYAFVKSNLQMQMQTAQDKKTASGSLNKECGIALLRQMSLKGINQAGLDTLRTAQALANADPTLAGAINDITEARQRYLETKSEDDLNSWKDKIEAFEALFGDSIITKQSVAKMGNLKIKTTYSGVKTVDAIRPTLHFS